MKNREIIVRILPHGVDCQETGKRGKIELHERTSRKAKGSAKKRSAKAAKGPAKKRSAKAAKGPAKKRTSRTVKRTAKKRSARARRLPSPKVLAKSAFASLVKEVVAADPSVEVARKIEEPQWLPRPENVAEMQVFEKAVAEQADAIKADAKKSKDKHAKRVVSALEKVMRKPAKHWSALHQAALWDDIEPAPTRSRRVSEYWKRIKKFDYEFIDQLFEDLEELKIDASNAISDGQPITENVKEALEILHSQKERLNALYGLSAEIAWQNGEARGRTQSELKALESFYLKEYKDDEQRIRSIIVDLRELARERNPRKNARSSKSRKHA